MRIVNYRIKRITSPYGDTEPLKMEVPIPFVMQMADLQLYSEKYCVVSQDDDGLVKVSVDEDDITIQGAYNLWLEMMKIKEEEK